MTKKEILTSCMSKIIEHVNIAKVNPIDNRGKLNIYNSPFKLLFGIPELGYVKVEVSQKVVMFYLDYEVSLCRNLLFNKTKLHIEINC